MSGLVENTCCFQFEEYETENGNVTSETRNFQNQFACYKGQYKVGMKLNARRKKEGERDRDNL